MRWPAEWEAQSAVLLTWPRAHGDFADFAQIEASFIAIAQALSKVCRVIISVDSHTTRQTLEQKLAGAGVPATVYIAPSNDVWVRDHGPIGVFEAEQLRLRKYRFNGWGGKYSAELDDRVAWQLNEQGAFQGLAELEEQGWVLEGGAVETDGAGTLLATRSSVLDPNRNTALDQAEVEDRLRGSLGIRHFHWLSHGELAGDDTDGHVDTLARFVAPGHIVYQGCADPDGVNYSSLAALRQELEALRQVDGSPYRLDALPWPQQLQMNLATALPTSYANFLILNGHLFLPQYGDPADLAAFEQMRKICPQYQVVPVDCQALVNQYGGLHCATMNIPDPRP